MAYKLDEEAGNTLWRDAIDSEMGGVRVAFDVKGKDDKPPPGYKYIPLHLVFDIKMDFRRKARLVAGGFKTNPPRSQTYSSVVSRETVRIAFLYAAMMDLDVATTDITLGLHPGSMC